MTGIPEIDASFLIINLSLYGLFFFILFLLFLAYLNHVFTNLRSKGPSIIANWFDYGVFLLLLMILIICYMKYLIDLQGNQIKIPDFYSTTQCKLLNLLFYAIVFVIVINNLITNFEGFEVCYTMNAIVKIKVQEESQFTIELNKINASKTPKRRKYCIEMLICTVLLLVGLYFLYTAFNNKNGTMITIISIYICVPLYLINLITEFLTVYMLKNFKKRLLNNNYYNTNLTMQAIYNLKASKLIFFSDFITYKSILDFTLCFPNLIFYINGNLSFINAIIAMVVYINYFLFLGSIYLYVDKTNKIYIKPLLRCIFFYNHFNVSFGEKEKAKLFEEYLLDQGDESKLIGKSFLFPPDKPIFEMENNNDKALKGYHPVNFYLIYKLLEAYFDNNKDKYRQIEETFEEGSDPREYINIIYEMQKNLDISLNNTLNPREEKNFFNDFNELYVHPNISDRDSLSSVDSHASRKKKDLNFKITAMFPERYTQVYPNFNMSIDNIIASLNPKQNADLSRSNFSKKCSDASYNMFFTYDKQLCYEVYNYEDELVLDSTKISYFSDEYMKFFTSNVIKEKKKTFIPFIIGVFLIKYYDYKKIVVIYKNPYHFINEQKTTLSVLFTLSEGDQKEVRIDKETEEKEFPQLKDTIKCQSQEDFNQIQAIASNDYLLINKLGFASYNKLNVCASIYKNVQLEVGKEEDKYELYTNLKVREDSIVIKISFSELFRTSVDPSMKDIVKEDSNSHTYSKYIQHQITDLIKPKELLIEE